VEPVDDHPTHIGKNLLKYMNNKTFKTSYESSSGLIFIDWFMTKKYIIDLTK
jgi:hypothetical protein